MKIKKHTVNKLGLEMIRQQLLSRCKPSVVNGWLDDDLISSRRSQEMLSAWATALEDVLDSGNGDELEISQHHAISGHVEHLSVTDEGIDVEEVKYD